MDYRIEKLVKGLTYQKIIIYGTGINAKILLNSLNDKEVVGILDRDRNSGYFEGKRILTTDEMLLYQPEAIIIATQLSATLPIYYRIRKLCLENEIVLLDLFGNDLFELVNSIEKQKEYSKKNIEELKNEIDQHEVITFDIFDTLIMRNTLYPEDVFHIVESRSKKKGIVLDDFANKRILAEQALKCISPNIYQIYDEYQAREGITSADKRLLLDNELSVEKNILIKRETVVDMMNYAFNKNKSVYLISDMYLPKEILEILLKNLDITSYHDILVSCDYHQTKFTGLYHIFMDLHPAASYLHIGDNVIADGFCAKSNGMDIYITPKAASLLEDSSYGHILKKALSVNERSMLGLFVAKIFNSPFSLNGSDRRPYINNIQDISYLYFAPLILKLVLWLIDILSQENYDKVLFSARDGFLIQELYDYIKAQLNKTELPESIYFQASRMLCARAGLSSDSDIEWMLSAPFSCSWNEIVKERFDLKASEMLDAHDEIYNSVVEYAISQKNKIYKHVKEIRANYNKYMKQLGLQQNGKYAFYDFVSCGTCQYFLSNFVLFDLKGLYCGYYDSVTGGKRNIPIKALFYNPNYFQKETFFFKHYLLLESILTSTSSSVINMDNDGEPIFSKERRSSYELSMVMDAQKSIKKYAEKYITSLYVDTSSINADFVDTIFSLFSPQYTNEDCAEFKKVILLDDFGKNLLEITRKERQ